MTTAQIAPPATITPQVSTRLLAQLPRFFTGEHAAYQELMQNAVRAGAQTLAITLSPDGTQLTFADDGPGLSEPQVLLTAADSHWTPEIMQRADPAGLGALSTLNPELVSRVTFGSRDWQFTLTPAEFAAAAPIPVQRRDPAIGMSVTLTFLKPQVEPPLRAALQRVRARAPLTITFQGEVLPSLPLPGTPLKLPSGTVHFADQFNYLDTTYWEGFPVSCTVNEIGLDVSRAATVFIANHRLDFLPAPHSGIRPKLPDRNAMLQNEAWMAFKRELYSAVQTIINRVGAALDLRATLLTEENVFRTLQEHNDPDYPLKEDVLRAHLQDHGFVPMETFNDATYHTFNPDPEDNGTWGQNQWFIQQALAHSCRCGEATSLLALKTQFPALPYGYEPLVYSAELDSDTHFAFQQHPFHREFQAKQAAGKITLCQTLTYAGIPLPWFVRGQELYLAGDPNAAEATLRAQLTPISAAFLQGALSEGDLQYDLDLNPWEGSHDLYPEEVGKWLLGGLISAYFPERAEAALTRERLREQLASWQQLSTLISRHPAFREEAAPLAARLERESAEATGQCLRLTTTFRLVD